ncbi:cytochrome C1 [Bacillus sp. OxB-1]|nr:cytochrome C1 [Bacillus sp. OxB-1]
MLGCVSGGLRWGASIECKGIRAREHGECKETGCWCKQQRVECKQAGWQVGKPVSCKELQDERKEKRGECKKEHGECKETGCWCKQQRVECKQTE